MGAIDSDRLRELYTNHIGTPSTDDEVYGYWLFVLGLVAAFVGIALVLPTGTGDMLRGAGIAIAAIGLVLLLLGPIIRLPLRRNATFIAYIGSLVAVLAVVWFTREFSQDNWSASFDNNEPFVIAAYGLGVLVIAVGGIVTPMLSGPREKQEAAQRRGTAAEAERDRAAEEAGQQTRRAAEEAERADEERAQRILLAAELQRIENSQSQFELYTDRAGEHRWRLRHRNRNIIADSGEGYSSRRTAQQGISAVRRDALGAALVDLDRTAVDIDAADEAVEGAEAPEFVAGTESRATFETYEDADDRFRWRLRHDNGNVIADSGQGYSRAETRENAIEQVRRYAATADSLRVDPAAFEIARDRAGKFRWRLLHRNGNILADSGQGYSSPQKARQGIASVQGNAPEDGDAEFEVYVDSSGEYRWRLVHRNGNIIADSGQGYASESGAEDAVERIRVYAPEAHVLDIGSAAFEIYEDEADEWRWRLRHRNGRIMADSGEGYASRSNAEDAVRSVKRNAPNADTEAVLS